jgi:hypothetical protein
LNGTEEQRAALGGLMKALAHVVEPSPNA